MEGKIRKRKWSQNQLIEAVKISFSYRQVLAKLGLREAGGNYQQLKKYITDSNLSSLHFKGRRWNSGLSGIGKPRRTLEEILKRNSPFQSFKLKKRLFRAELKKPQCEQCGWAQQTVSGHLPLELDHINGDRTDNRLENLRILCPNCHSLTTTYRSRKRN